MKPLTVRWTSRPCWPLATPSRPWPPPVPGDTYLAEPRSVVVVFHFDRARRVRAITSYSTRSYSALPVP